MANVSYYGKVLFSLEVIPFFFFLKILFIFRERGGREKEREKSIDWLALSHPQRGMAATRHVL